MKNHMEEVAKLLGVEIGEEFDISGFDFNPFKLTDDGLLDKDEDNAGGYFFGK